MFTRDSRQTAIDTLIGKSARLEGDLAFEGGLHVDGHIVGSVRALGQKESSLSVSAGGSIEGTVQVPNVTLEGTVKGDIHATGRVVIGASARVQGDVHYGVIEMTVGAQIMGKLVRLAPEAPA